MTRQIHLRLRSTCRWPTWMVSSITGSTSTCAALSRRVVAPRSRSYAVIVSASNGLMVRLTRISAACWMRLRRLDDHQDAVAVHNVSVEVGVAAG